MSKPFATAIVKGYRSEPETIPIIKSRARSAVASFYAPTWRPMAFRTVEAAKAKMERHPGFVRWVA